MPKFRISFSVDSANLGPVLAAVHEYGVGELDFGIIETVPHNKNVRRNDSAGPRKGGASNALLDALKASPEHSMTLREAVRALDKAGFYGKGIYAVRTALARRGEVEFNSKNKTLRLAK